MRRKANFGRGHCRESDHRVKTEHVKHVFCCILISGIVLEYCKNQYIANMCLKKGRWELIAFTFKQLFQDFKVRLRRGDDEGLKLAAVAAAAPLI